ncbi:nucleic acid-binding protein [bacterium]|nr:nucleic acid-binding protein [bacterium]
MKIYLDLCAIQRPLDTPDQVRIVLDSEAVLGVIAFCAFSQVELVSSELLFYEAEQCSLPIRKEHTHAVLAKAKSYIKITEPIKQRAEYLTTFGINALDALHVALAESGHAEFFGTCDDKLLRNAKHIQNLKIQVVNPVDLIQEIEKWLRK